MTWEIFKEKWAGFADRDDIPEQMRKEYISDLADCLENEGFSKVFWSDTGDYSEYYGKPFTVLGRVLIHDGADINDFPRWNIQFEDGKTIEAYQEEINVRFMKDHGCPKKYLKMA